MSLFERRTLATGLVLAALHGCQAGDQRSSEGVSAQDSTSVSIVTSRGPDVPLGTREVLRLGAIEGAPEYLFDAIRSVSLAPDGTIWVSDSDPSIRRYSADGQYLNSAGREGEGPGESPRGYGDVWAGEESVVTFPYGLRVLQQFGNDGSFIGDRMAIDDDGTILVPLGSTGADWYFRTSTFPRDQGPRVREQWTVSRSAFGDETANSILSLPGDPQAQRSYGGWGNGSYLDGFPSLAASDRGLYYSHPTEYDIQLFDEEGRLLRRVRRDTPRTPVDPTLMSRLESELDAGWSERLGTPIDADSRRGMLQALEPREPTGYLPQLDLVLPASDGAMWVRRADQHPDPAAFAVAIAMGYIRTAWLDRWKAESVFDVFWPDGAYRGTVRFPHEFSPLDATRDRIYGAITDDLGVNYVVAYELEQPSD